MTLLSSPSFNAVDELNSLCFCLFSAGVSSSTGLNEKYSRSGSFLLLFAMIQTFIVLLFDA